VVDLSIEGRGVHNLELFDAPRCLLLLLGRYVNWCLSQTVEEVYGFGHAATMVVVGREGILHGEVRGYLLSRDEVVSGCNIVVVGYLGYLRMSDASEEGLGVNLLMFVGRELLLLLQLEVVVELGIE